jgi:5-methylcytosine-specific restriction endonuclease McrA
MEYKTKASLASSRWNKANRARINATEKARYKRDPSKKKQSAAAWSYKNPDAVRINDKSKRLANPSKYRALANASCRKYQCSKMNRTPKWLNENQLLEIKEFYIVAAELSWLSEGGLEVDHIVPLQGKNVSGLHVPWNLQIIPTRANQIKGNNYE